jgi:hypothetical protein
MKNYLLTYVLFLLFIDHKCNIVLVKDLRDYSSKPRNNLFHVASKHDTYFNKIVPIELNSADDSIFSKKRPIVKMDKSDPSKTIIINSPNFPNTKKNKMIKKHIFQIKQKILHYTPVKMFTKKHQSIKFRKAKIIQDLSKFIFEDDKDKDYEKNLENREKFNETINIPIKNLTNFSNITNITNSTNTTLPNPIYKSNNNTTKKKTITKKSKSKSGSKSESESRLGSKSKSGSKSQSRLGSKSESKSSRVYEDFFKNFGKLVNENKKIKRGSQDKKYEKFFVYFDKLVNENKKKHVSKTPNRLSKKYNKFFKNFEKLTNENKKHVKDCKKNKLDKRYESFFNYYKKSIINRIKKDGEIKKDDKNNNQLPEKDLLTKYKKKEKDSEKITKSKKKYKDFFNKYKRLINDNKKLTKKPKEKKLNKSFEEFFDEYKELKANYSKKKNKKAKINENSILFFKKIVYNIIKKHKEIKQKGKKPKLKKNIFKDKFNLLTLQQLSKNRENLPQNQQKEKTSGKLQIKSEQKPKQIEKKCAKLPIKVEQKPKQNEKPCAKLPFTIEQKPKQNAKRSLKLPFRIEQKPKHSVKLCFKPPQKPQQKSKLIVKSHFKLPINIEQKPKKIKKCTKAPKKVEQKPKKTKECTTAPKKVEQKPKIKKDIKKVLKISPNKISSENNFFLYKGHSFKIETCKNPYLGAFVKLLNKKDKECVNNKFLKFYLNERYFSISKEFNSDKYIEIMFLNKIKLDAIYNNCFTVRSKNSKYFVDMCFENTEIANDIYNSIRFLKLCKDPVKLQRHIEQQGLLKRCYLKYKFMKFLKK